MNRPELFRFTGRADRATKLLSYLGDVIVNGNPEVKGKRYPRTIERRRCLRFPESRRQRERANCCRNWDQESLPRGRAKKSAC